MLGIGVGALALVVVMSAFNGLDQLVKDLYTNFDPDIKVSIVEGKVFEETLVPLEEIRALEGVAFCSAVLEEEVFFQYKGNQAIARMKGVDEEFLQVAELKEQIYDGELMLNYEDRPFAVLGYGVAEQLDLYINNAFDLLKVYAAKRNVKSSLDPTKKFKVSNIDAAGIFATNTEADMKYVLVPLDFARELLDYPAQLSGFEMRIHPGHKPEAVAEQVKQILGDNFEVKTRLQQNELLYKTNRTEKWITYLILTFILVIATFNLIGSITMLIIDKKDDIAILRSLGATKRMVRQAFLLEGLLIALIGGLSGLVLGLLICGMQQWFGLVSLENALVEYYPILMKPLDFVAILLTVLVLGYLSSWLPSRIATDRYFN